MPAKTNKLPGFLFLILIAALAAILTDQLTDWSTWVKLIPSIIFTLIGLITLFGSSKPSSSLTAAANPAPAPTTSTVARTIAAANKPAEKSDAEVIGDFLGSLIMLAMVGGVIYGIVWLYGLLVNEANSIKNNYNSGIVNTEFLVGHSYNQREETEYDRRLKKDVTYDVFTLKKGQHWKWYFDKDIYYRIRADGGDDFVLLERLKHTGSEYTANYNGTLQVRSPVDYNHVTITRLVDY